MLKKDLEVLCLHVCNDNVKLKQTWPQSLDVDKYILLLAKILWKRSSLAIKTYHQLNYIMPLKFVSSINFLCICLTPRWNFSKVFVRDHLISRRWQLESVDLKFMWVNNLNASSLYSRVQYSLIRLMVSWLIVCCINDISLKYWCFIDNINI